MSNQWVMYSSTNNGIIVKRAYKDGSCIHLSLSIFPILLYHTVLGTPIKCSRRANLFFQTPSLKIFEQVGITQSGRLPLKGDPHPLSSTVRLAPCLVDQVVLGHRLGYVDVGGNPVR
jgi:hypothetical protein